MTTEGRTSNAGPERRKEAVRKATADDASRLARTLAQAFYEDPLMRWILPNGSRHQRQLYRSFDSIFLKRLCLPHHEIYNTKVSSEGRSGCHRVSGRSAYSITSGCCPTSPRPGAVTCPGHCALAAT